MIDARLACTLAALASVIGISVMLAGIPSPLEALELQEPVSNVEILPRQDSASPPQETAAPYLLKEYQGRVAVFHTGSEEPDYVFATLVKYLPAYDQMLMQEGIPARDEAHLASLIEDYIS